MNPYENILPYLTMEESQEVRAEQVKANIERGKRLKRRETPSDKKSKKKVKM